MDSLLKTLRALAEDPAGNATALGVALAIVVVFVTLIVLTLIGFALPEESKQTTSAPRPESMIRRRLGKWTAILVTGPLATLAVAAAVALWYEQTSTNTYCARTCHAMAEPAQTWELSAHADVACIRCHEGRKWESFFSGVRSRMRSLRYQVTGTPGTKEPLPPERCMSCHANVMEKPLRARNGETFLHGEALTEDPACVRCHGAQGHVPPRL